MKYFRDECEVALSLMDVEQALNEFFQKRFSTIHDFIISDVEFVGTDTEYFIKFKIKD